MPDARQDREGPQTGDATIAWVKSTPRAASRSMFGVGTGTSGLRPNQSQRCWSDNKNRKFGRATALGPGMLLESQPDRTLPATVAPASSCRRVTRLSPLGIPLSPIPGQPAPTSTPAGIVQRPESSAASEGSTPRFGRVAGFSARQRLPLIELAAKPRGTKGTDAEARAPPRFTAAVAHNLTRH